jgi:hypothetical protein
VSQLFHILLDLTMVNVGPRWLRIATLALIALSVWMFFYEAIL